MSKPIPNLYAILRIPMYASTQDIQNAMKKFAQRAQGERDLKILTQCKKYLLNTRERQQYDARLLTDYPELRHQAKTLLEREIIVENKQPNTQALKRFLVKGWIILLVITLPILYGNYYFSVSKQAETYLQIGIKNCQKHAEFEELKYKVKYKGQAAQPKQTENSSIDVIRVEITESKQKDIGHYIVKGRQYFSDKSMQSFTCSTKFDDVRHDWVTEAHLNRFE